MILLKLTGHFGRKMCVIVKCRSLFIYLFLLSNFICKKKRNLSSSFCFCALNISMELCLLKKCNSNYQNKNNRKGADFALSGCCTYINLDITQNIICISTGEGLAP